MSDVTQDGKIAAQKGNDVSWHDELRAALEETPCPRYYDFGPECISVVDAQKIVDTFAAAHPGLVEVVRCGECERLGRDVERGDDECSKAPLWCYELLFEPEDETFYCADGQRKETPEVLP